MNFKEARNAIVSRFLGQFNSTYEIAIDNKKFTPPDNDSWMRISVVFNTGGQETLGRIGNRKFARLGITTVQVFTPINTGTNVNDDLCQDVLELLDGISIDRLRSFNGRTVTIGADGESFQQNAVIEFEFDETR